MRQWDGGKGDGFRKVDVQKYTSNFDKIDFSGMREKKIMRFLLLDDERIPENCFLYDEEMTLEEASGIPPQDWDIVRSYEEFKDYIDRHGIPDAVSFDHDLDRSSVWIHLNDLEKGISEYDRSRYTTKTGLDCAEYLKEICQKLKVDIPQYHIHSANSHARPAIRKILDEKVG